MEEISDKFVSVYLENLDFAFQCFDLPPNKLHTIVGHINNDRAVLTIQEPSNDNKQ